MTDFETLTCDRLVPCLYALSIFGALISIWIDCVSICMCCCGGDEEEVDEIVVDSDEVGGGKNRSGTKRRKKRRN